jgi:hypothetical protein
VTRTGQTDERCFRQGSKNINSLESGELHLIRPETLKRLDGCRSLFQTERALHRFAPV